MKKIKLVGLLSLLLSLGVVGCGESDAPVYESDKTYHWLLTPEGEVDKETKVKHEFGEPVIVTPATCTAVGKQKEICKVCGYVKESDTKKLDHVMTVDVPSKKVDPTCDVAGKTVKKCANCDHEEETAIPAKGHTFTSTTISTYVEGVSSAVVHEECSTCHQKRITVDAMKYTKLQGSKKSAPDETLKLNANNDYVEYKFTMPAAFTGTAALYGWVDYWKDGSNNNDQRGFTSRKSGQGFNVSLNINDQEVEITNLGTYESMGMTAGQGGNGSFTLCDLGAATLPAGEITLTYTRIESYNLNISQIVFYSK